MRRLRTAGGPRAPERVRAWLQATTEWLPREVEANLVLLTCELVNNSVTHGRAGDEDVIEIEVRATSRGVRAQVSDSGAGFAPGEWVDLYWGSRQETAITEVTARSW